MSLYDDLKKKEHVKNHPMIKRSEGFAEWVRSLRAKHAQQVELDLSQSQEELDWSQIPDNFSSEFGEGYLKNKRMSLEEVKWAAYDSVLDALGQFDTPFRPEVSYNNTKDVKTASDDSDKVISANVIFNVKFKTLTGGAFHGTIPVPISRGIVLDPSVITVNGSDQILAQSTIDHFVKRNTSYYRPNLRKMYDPPLSAEEKIMEADLRNDIGYVPRSYEPNSYMGKESAGKTPYKYKEVVKHLEKLEKDGEETFPRTWEYIYGQYILEFLSEASKDQWYPHLVNDGFVINTLDTNRGRGRKKAQEEPTGEFSEEAPSEKQPVENKKKDKQPQQLDGVYYYPGTRAPIEVNDKVKFEVEGGGTLSGIITSISGDMALVRSNKGYDYEINVGNIKPFPSTFKKMYVAQMTPVTDSQTESEMGSRYYSGTIMPIEPQDRVKFMAKSGPIRGYVSDIGDNDFVHVESDGLTYRVHQEDIEPLQSTYKKMWQAPVIEVEDE